MVASPPQKPVPVGVKLGSTRTVVVLADGDGRRIEQTLTCLATYDHPVADERRVLFGQEAADEYPDRVRFPLRAGLPEDEESVADVARFLGALVDEYDIPEESTVVFAVPTGGDEAGLGRLERLVEESHIGTRTRSFPEALCGALPALGERFEALRRVFAVLNLGSTTLEAVAYRRGTRLLGTSTGSVTGNWVDRRIAAAVEAETGGRVRLDRTTAREYKERHADFEAYEPFSGVVQQPGGGAHEFTVRSGVMEPLEEYVDRVVDVVADRFLADLAASNLRLYRETLASPLVVTGGMACVPGLVETLETRLTDELGREVGTVAPSRPDLAAARGAHRIARRLVERG
jgi:hypothetical protein